MELTKDQEDALKELINIGYGRAAGALSELTGHRIGLEVPRVAVHEIDNMGAILEDLLGSSIASVNQVFSGSLNGNALLLLNEESAVALSQLLSDERPISRFDSNAKEIITEVGNILLNACLGVFGNLLCIRITFTVPKLTVDSSAHLVHGLAAVSEEKMRYALMVHTRFQVKARDVTGFLVIVLGIASLDRLVRELKNWEGRGTK
ncbi:MAG TPA: chemotaxis protein CheC [Opitutaceae bacterium]|jgi:chemotaxis protein CheC